MRCWGVRPVPRQTTANLKLRCWGVHQVPKQTMRCWGCTSTTQTDNSKSEDEVLGSTYSTQITANLKMRCWGVSPVPRQTTANLKMRCWIVRPLPKQTMSTGVYILYQDRQQQIKMRCWDVRPLPKTDNEVLGCTSTTQNRQ